MATDKHRLLAWMNKTGYDREQLERTLGMRFSLKFVLGGANRIPNSLYCRFRDTFGETAFEEVFGSDRKDHFARHAAWLATLEAMSKGILPRAKECNCHHCSKPAQCHHHPSYHPDDRLCVVPLCFKCHMSHHKSGMELRPMGIVVTPIGILRIAIATAPELTHDA